MSDTLPITQRRVLEAVATYRLLNPQQLVRAGAGNSEATVRAAAAALFRKKLIGQSANPLVSGVRRLPRLHWLTDAGANLLPDDGAGGPLGARREMGESAHIMHRISVVEVHLALRAWAALTGRQVPWFRTDFEPGSGGLRRPTTIPYDNDCARYTADALADVIGPDGHSRLLVLESERGRREGKRLTEFRAKLAQLREVSERYLVEDHFGRPKHRARFLIVFARADTRDKALAAWPDPQATAWHNFFIKCDADLANFNAGWRRPGDDGERPLFAWGTSAQPTTATPLPGV